MIKICVAVDSKWGFAKDNKIPWNIPEDFKHFITTTSGTSCITGRNSYEEMVQMKRDRLNERYDPSQPILPNRTTYVVSSTLPPLTDAVVMRSLPNALSHLQRQPGDIFILGGERIFQESIDVVDKVILTEIPGDYQCDRFFPHEYLLQHFKVDSTRYLDTKDHGELIIKEFLRVSHG